MCAACVFGWGLATLSRAAVQLQSREMRRRQRSANIVQRFAKSAIATRRGRTKDVTDAIDRRQHQDSEQLYSAQVGHLEEHGLLASQPAVGAALPETQKRAASLIQASARMRRGRQEFQEALKAARCIEAACRLMLAKQMAGRLRDEHAKQKQIQHLLAVTIVQAYARRLKSRMRLLRSRSAATTIAARTRGCLARAVRRRQQCAVIKLQAHARGRKIRTGLEIESFESKAACVSYNLLLVDDLRSGDSHYQSMLSLYCRPGHGVCVPRDCLRHFVPKNSLDSTLLQERRRDGCEVS